MKTEAQKRARKNYRKKIKTYTLECYPETEPELIAKIEEEKEKGKKNIAGGYAAYIKKLIREDIART